MIRYRALIVAVRCAHRTAMIRDQNRLLALSARSTSGRAGKRPIMCVILEGTPYSYQQTPCFRLHRAFRNPSKSRVRGAGGLAPLGIEGSGVHGSLSLQSPGSWGASPPRDRGVGVHGSLSPPILRFLPPVALSPLPLLLPAVVRQSYSGVRPVSVPKVDIPVLFSPIR